MRIMARKAKGIKCSFCKRFGHFLFQDNEDGTVTINCPKSTFAGRKFKNSKEFLERLEVQDVCQDLWDLDERLRPGVDYEITPNSDRFFDFVSESVFEKELYKSFWDLLVFYQNRRPTSAEPYSSQKANELYRFIDLVMETGVMKRCLDVLARDGWCQGNVRRKIYQMWFKLDRENECAFRRIFVGEVCWNRQYGHDVVLHNWIQYFKQESEENIVYNKWIGDQAPSPDASIATISYCWMCESTPRRSMFLGTSPAFEVALYTYLSFVGERNQPNKLKFGDRPVDVVLCKENGNIRRAYPVEVVEHRKDDASGDVIKDLASILWRAIAGLYNPSKYDQEHASLMR